jgi:hypothetical protein
MNKFIFRGRMKLTGAIILLACLFFLAGAANATIIYDNLDSPSGGVDPIQGWYDSVYGPQSPPLFNSFLVGSVGFSLDSIELLLKRDSTVGGGFTVYLYSCGAIGLDGLPPAPSGTALRTTSLSDSVLSTDPSVVLIPIAPALTLAPNTRYWVVLNSTSASNPSTANWSWSEDLEGTIGVSGEFTGHGPYVYLNDEYGPYQMAIPLPGAVWLLGSGLAGLGLWRARKRFKV